MKTITCEITDMTLEGEGFGRVDRKAVFMVNGILGEVATGEIIEDKGNYLKAVKIRTETPSPFEIEPYCPHFFVCDGCSMQNITAESQEDIKSRQIRDAINRIAKVPIDSIGYHSMKSPYHYRNKVELKLNGTGDVGYFNRKTRRHVPIKTCKIADKAIDEFLPYLQQDIHDSGLKGYEGPNEEGTVKNIILRSNKKGELMVILTTSKGDFKGKEEWFDRLKKHSAVASLFHSVNLHSRNLSLGKTLYHIYGEKNLVDTIGDRKFTISPPSFFQINNAQTEILYDVAKNSLLNYPKGKILDLYCGIGSITLYMADRATSILGVESVDAAVSDAKFNADLNAIANATFTAAKSEEILNALFVDHNFDTIIVDPPRKGLDRKVVEAIIQSSTKVVLYISCNPGTLARDLAWFDNGGFEVKNVTGVDMFPQTMHVECIALIQRAGL